MSKETRRGMRRRDFLRSAAIAGATIGAPMIVPSSVLGGDGHTAPGNRITIGSIGIGAQGGGLLGHALSQAGAQVVAVCDVESGRLEKAKSKVEDAYAKRFGAGEYKGCDAYGDFRELLARPGVDAVIIATPDHWHALIAIAACQAGKDVYCEKPLAETIHEARAMADAARQYGRVFQTGSMQRSDRTFRFACELVRNGRIGKVHTIHVNVGGPPKDCYLPAEPTPPTLDWDMWLGPAPWRPYHSELCPINFKGFPHWRQYRDYGGGGMTDFGAHHYDIAQWGLGMDNTGPVEVVPPDGKDVKRLTYKYANGVVMFHGGGMNGAATDFIGTEGRVAVNRGQWLRTEPESLKREVFGPGDVHLYESRDQMGDWLDCVRNRAVPICPPRISCRTATICHIGNICYLLNRPLKWDPEKERFVGDDGANRLLQRPMRAPWQV